MAAIVSKKSKAGSQPTVLVGEGSAEPTVGFEWVQQWCAPATPTFFFGVRRSAEGLAELAASGADVVANFPGRGMAPFGNALRDCGHSSFNVCRLIDSGRLTPDVLLVVATAPDANGWRSTGTVNGLLQSAVERARHIVIEEFPQLPIIAGAVAIPPEKVLHVMPHQPAAFAALSRQADDGDHACAAHIARLLDSDITLQLGVGGIVEALADELRQRRQLRIVSGAIGSTIRALNEAGSLQREAPILGTALVGDESLVDWAAHNPSVRLMSSRQIHNPAWLRELPRFHSVNIGLTVDIYGNVNAEIMRGKRISGRGGSPNFSAGASTSAAGLSIVALRANRGPCLVERIDAPTIRGHHVDAIVTEAGVALLKGKSAAERERLLRELFARA